jgi:hypothetical protein
MEGPKRAGRYRIRLPQVIFFFYVWYSNSSGEWVICDVKDREGEYVQYLDRDSKRPLTDAMWARLVTWC